MQIKVITDDLIPQLEVFCKQAEKLGYQNNSSLKAMKYDWCKERGEYFCAIVNETIVAVAGCHPLPEVGENAWRILFRGCELPQNDTFLGLGKGDWNSITQREIIPKFIEYCPTDELYITTNTHHEHSNGKAARNHKLMGLLAKQKILDKHSEMELYYTHQAVWKLNIKEYNRRRNLLKGSYVVQS
jgi:hypothetical protein|tara:strand:- start:9356 stop:9913 length:558 start_codon:yes stop_codon:yes gene_type:complete